MHDYTAEQKYNHPIAQNMSQLLLAGINSVLFERVFVHISATAVITICCELFKCLNCATDVVSYSWNHWSVPLCWQFFSVGTLTFRVCKFCCCSFRRLPVQTLLFRKKTCLQSEMPWGCFLSISSLPEKQKPNLLAEFYILTLHSDPR